MVLGWTLLGDDPSYFGKAGAAFEFGEKGLHGIHRSLAETLDRTVPQVSNPARKPAEAAGRSLREGPVADALHPAVGHEVNGGFHG